MNNSPAMEGKGAESRSEGDDHAFNLTVNTVVDCLDEKGIWLPATILQVR